MKIKITIGIVLILLNTIGIIEVVNRELDKTLL